MTGRLLSLLTLFLLGCVWRADAQQETIISGRVTEKGKAEPIPFVSIGFAGTNIGTTSNFEGEFTLKTTEPVDSIIISYVGYETYRKKIIRGQKQFLVIELKERTNDLLEVVVRPGVNPAIRIVKNAQEMRDRNDQSNLKCYEYESYNKIDVSMDNISEKVKNNRMFAPIKELFDTANQIINDEGKYVLPLLISETHSQYYQNNNPSVFKEVIKGSKVTGFAVEQGSYLTDLLGSSLIQFNFNQNWMRIFGKDFISPIATGGNNYYIYTLLDSVDIDGHKCYKIKLNLRREEDLGFLGTMWIADSTFAIKRIQVELAPSANINFVERFKIQQEMMQTVEGPWLPEKTRLIFDLSQVTENTSGLIAQMYRSNKNVVINQPKPPSFFDIQVEREEDAEDKAKDSAYWEAVRTEPFSNTQKAMQNMIDSVKELPAVKTYIEIIRIAFEGYFRAGKYDIGPYILFFGYNNVQGLRLRVGIKTNMDFSKHWVLRPYIAYGVNNEKLKYGMGVDYVFSRRKWCIGSFQFKDDYDILGVSNINPYNTLQVNSTTSSVMSVASFGSPQSRINRTVEYQFNFIRQVSRDWTYRVGLQHTYFNPEGKFAFAYIVDRDKPTTAGNVKNDFTYNAITGEVRYAFKEHMVVRGSDRVRMTMPKAPAFTFTYTRGFEGVLGGDFDYQKMQLNINQYITTGVFGNAIFNINLGKVYGRLPYPMLDVPMGNPSFFYSDRNYSLMNQYEFVADEYSQVSYVQHFEGFFTNRVPLLKKWHLRNFAFVKGAYGHLKDENKEILPAMDEQGDPLSVVYEFKNEPYAEIGYGFENIFRFMTISAVHRLTYLDNQNVRKWGINVGVLFNF
jgi:hypothetical protein